MSNGLKNIQAASRAAARRARHEAGQPPLPYDDDSGVSGMGGGMTDELDASYSSPGSTGSHHSTSGTAAPGNYSTAPMQTSYQSYYPAPTHGYTSSVSSMQTAQPSQSNSPYMGHHNRLPSVDMGIESIINRAQ